MIKRLLLATTMLIGCNSITGVEETTPQLDTVYVRDTLKTTDTVISYEIYRDTIYVEYDYYKYDTVMIITNHAGRYMVYDNRIEGLDTVWEHIKWDDTKDTLKFSSPRHATMTYTDPNGSWVSVDFRGEIRYMDDGYFYYYSGGKTPSIAEF